MQIHHVSLTSIQVSILLTEYQNLNEYLLSISICFSPNSYMYNPRNALSINIFFMYILSNSVAAYKKEELLTVYDDWYKPLQYFHLQRCSMLHT